MTAQTLSVAAVGAGYFSQFHLAAWQKIDGVRLVAVCDSDEERARRAAEQSGAGRHFTRFEEMLDACEPDLVDIITPEDSHLQFVRAAADRGLPAICQKPLGADLAAAIEIVEVAERRGTLLVVHENARWRPWFRKCAQMIAEGQLGRPHAITFRLRPGDGQGADAYLARQPFFQAMKRFLIHETGIHNIDTFRYLMGEVTGVFARLRRINPVIAGEDAGYVIFEFENGAAGLFDGNRCNDHAADDHRLTMGEMWIEGSRGVLRLDGWGRLFWREHLRAERPVAYAWTDDGSFGGGCVEAFQRHVIEHLRGRVALEQSARDFLRNVAVEEAIYTSARTGRWQSVPDIDPHAGDGT